MNAGPGAVVVGCGPAGLAAATAFREQDPDTPVTILQGETMACYARPRLPEVLAGSVSPEQIQIHNASWYQTRRFNLRLGAKVEAIDRLQHILRLTSGETLAYTRLILAPGAEPIHPPIEGLPLPRVHVLRTLEDAVSIRACAQGHRVAALVGGGLLGLEAGSALTRLGLRVVVIESGSWLLPRQIDAEGSALLQQRLGPLGFEFYVGTSVQRIAMRGEQVNLTLADGAQLTVDLALLSAGVRPRIGLARAAGLDCERGILVDDFLRTSDPDVFAAGDAVQWRGTVPGLWSIAQAMGRIAGGNAAGLTVMYPGHMPTTTLKVAGVPLVSQGETHPDVAHVLTRRDEVTGDWVKLFLREGRLIGAIQMGTTVGSRKYQRLIQSGVSVAGFEEALLSADFDFTQLSGYSES